jgi:molybdopterin/thiamine biosynthesis adenylyltransferase
MTKLHRFARSPKLLSAPRELQAALRDARVAIIGCGSVGQHLARGCAQLGVAELLLVDRARLKPESFLTHPCHPADLGRPKVQVAGELAHALSPQTRVRVFHGAFDELPTDLLAGCTVVLLASDNLQCEVSAGQRTVSLGVPLIQAAVHGPTLVAEVRCFPNRPGSPAACPACILQRAEWQAYDRGTRFSCAGERETPAGSTLPSQLPTASFPQLCGMAAELASIEWIRQLAGVADDAQSRQIQYGGYTHRTSETKLSRRESCPVDHRTLRILGAGRALANATTAELLNAAGCSGDDLGRVTLQAEAHRYVGYASCGCSEHPPLGRFYREHDDLGRCSHCHTVRALHPLHTREQVPLSLLNERLDRPLARLGAGAARAVWLRSESQGVLFHAGPDLNSGPLSGGEAR